MPRLGLFAREFEHKQIIGTLVTTCLPFEATRSCLDLVSLLLLEATLKSTRGVPLLGLREV
jgi:hypothetical protein